MRKTRHLPQIVTRVFRGRSLALRGSVIGLSKITTSTAQWDRKPLKNIALLSGKSPNSAISIQPLNLDGKGSIRQQQLGDEKRFPSFPKQPNCVRHQRRYGGADILEDRGERVLAGKQQNRCQASAADSTRRAPRSPQALALSRKDCTFHRVQAAASAVDYGTEDLQLG